MTAGSPRNAGKKSRMLQPALAALPSGSLLLSLRVMEIHVNIGSLLPRIARLPTGDQKAASGVWDLAVVGKITSLQTSGLRARTRKSNAFLSKSQYLE